MRIVPAACAALVVAMAFAVQLGELAEPGPYRTGLPFLTNSYQVDAPAVNTSTATPTATVTPTGTATPTATSTATFTPTPTNTVPPSDPYPVVNTPTPYAISPWASPTPLMIPTAGIALTPYRPGTTPTPGASPTPGIIVEACFREDARLANLRPFSVDIIVREQLSFGTPEPRPNWDAQVDIVDPWAAPTPLSSATPTSTPLRRVFRPDPIMTPTPTPPIWGVTATPVPTGTPPTPTATPTNIPPMKTNDDGYARISAYMTWSDFPPMPVLRVVVGGVTNSGSTVYIESSLDPSQSANECR